MTDPLPETVLQFGTGRFLRAFADLFVHEANESAHPVGRVVVVQSTGTERAEMLGRRGGRYHVAIRGLERDRTVDRVVQVQSIGRALAAAENWDAVLDVARSAPLSTVVSNTTEAGLALDPNDRRDGRTPRSFPAKLLLVLEARFREGQPGVTVLPCELVPENGGRLKGLVFEQAARWGFARDLLDWLEGVCFWPSTLVDRIVASGPAPDDPAAAADPLLAVAEPFAQWLIEGEGCFPRGLAEHRAVGLVDDLEPFHLRKVRILNGAHTALVAKARPLGIETVRQAVEDPRVRPWLEGLLFEEIVPVLEDRTDKPEAFARDVLERLANPFLEHRLADIALHHEVKLQTRLAPTREEYCALFGRPPRRLEEILGTT